MNANITAIVMSIATTVHNVALHHGTHIRKTVNNAYKSFCVSTPLLWQRLLAMHNTALHTSVFFFSRVGTWEYSNSKNANSCH